MFDPKTKITGWILSQNLTKPGAFKRSMNASKIIPKTQILKIMPDLNVRASFLAPIRSTTSSLK